MALLSFRIVLLLFIKLVIINETVCFTGIFLPSNIFSNSLGYVSKRLNSFQPRFNLQKLLIPETATQNNNYARTSADLNKVLQNHPKGTTPPKTNVEILKSALSTERSNNKSTTQNSNIEDKEIDQKWNTFFDDYFKNQVSKTENSLTTKNIHNGETLQASKDILDEYIFEDKDIETTNDSVTDTTDTTPFDNETTTGDDDLLRNGVPPELLSSLLG